VDHGKTELVKALTGINTDRLAEEQARELSIDIGFAHLDLPDGTRVGLVDVPGHERFIKNMLAGATGIDLVMLIVAADEGVMPQTVEHLDIVTLLGIETGLVVMTKTDLVDEELAELAEEDIRSGLAGSPLADAPLVSTSARTGEGLEELVRVLAEVVAGVKRRDIRGPARLPIDRAFSMTGFGLVATGTLVRGRLSQGDEVEILPHGYRARIRGLQTHGVAVPEVAAARRVAVNLMRLSGEGVERGDTLCAPGSMTPSGLVDVRLSLLPRAPGPLKQRTRIRLHHGTAERLGRVYFMDRDALAPGDSCIAQVRLEGLVAAARGDRCVIRSYSPMATIGGAVVLDPAPTRHRGRDGDVVGKLESLEAGASVDLAREWIGARGQAPFTPRELSTALQLDPTEGEQIVADLLAGNEVVRLADGVAYVSAEAYAALSETTLAALAAYHASHALSDAMPKEALQAALKRPPAAVLDDMLQRLTDGGSVAHGPAGLRLAGHAVRLSAEHERALEAMRSIARRGRFAPPTREAVLAAAGRPTPEARALMGRLVDSGDLVIVGEHAYDREALGEIQRLLADHFREKGPFTVADLRDLTQSSRKYVVPLVEYLDGIGFTRRQGDLRIVTRPDG
jgi:selenocysteine-specific elongation factor